MTRKIGMGNCMRKRKFTFKFKGGTINVWAFCEKEGRILAQAEAIRKGWDYAIIEE